MTQQQLLTEVMQRVDVYGVGETAEDPEAVSDLTVRQLCRMARVSVSGLKKALRRRNIVTVACGDEYFTMTGTQVHIETLHFYGWQVVIAVEVAWLVRSNSSRRSGALKITKVA